MTFYEVVSRVASRTNKNVSDNVALSRLKNHVNDACQEIWDGFDWTFRLREYSIKTIADVTSGTMTATNGSQTITASGTPFVADHVGAWIRFTADSPANWYRVISYVSTSSVLIEPAYAGTTGASKAYELKKFDYLFPSEVLDFESVSATYAGHPLPVTFIADLARLGTPPLSKGLPQALAIFNADFEGSTYSTGTVSGTTGTNTLTGSGTTWLANVTPGDMVTIGSNTYTVFKVGSDTSITLYNYLQSTVAASAYSISRRFGQRVRITPSTDSVYTVSIMGLRRYPQMVHNNDVNALLQRYPSVVIEAAVWRELSSTPDSRADSIWQKSQAMLADAKSQDRNLTNRTLSVNPVWSDRNRGGDWRLR